MPVNLIFVCKKGELPNDMTKNIGDKERLFTDVKAIEIKI